MGALAENEILCRGCGGPRESTESHYGFCVRCMLTPLFDSDELSERSNDSWFEPYEIATHPDGSFIELGRGSMGITFRAFDTILEFPVALKVIDFKAAGLDGNRDRFLRGARAAARLRHPHIASVLYYGIREDGQCFYAMELVDGETLAERVRRGGPLPVENALELVGQVAGALAAAEKHGLVHRDLKPANIMLARGTGINAKLIDFGLAKTVSDEESPDQITQQGFVGTPAFASPEQFSGQKVDQRSDYFSLGTTLFYLLTGKPPFQAELSIVGSNQPRRAFDLGVAFDQLKAAGVPRPVQRLLGVLLSPDPKRRPQTGQELVDLIDRSRRAVSSPGKTRLILGATVVLAVIVAAAVYWKFAPAAGSVTKSIAVLPFDNLNPMGDKAYFADGVQDEVLTNLAKASDLQVISRSSVLPYRNSAKRPLPAQIARELHVNYVVNGSVERDADRIRVTVHLIEAKSGRELWAEHYDGELTNVFAIQAQIAEAISLQLQAKLSSAEKAAIEDVPTHDLAAYEAYVRAKALFDNYYETTQGWGPLYTGVQLLTEATNRDPNFALAWAKLGWAHDNLYWFNADHTEARRRAAQDALDKAMHLRPDLGQIHLAVAVHLFATRDYSAVRRELEIAQRTMPNSASVLGFMAATQARQGQWRDAIDNVNKALALDPKNFSLMIIRFDWYLYHRRYDDLRRFYQEASEAGMDSVSVDFNRAEMAFYENGDTSLYHGLFAGPVAPLRAVGRATLLKAEIGMIDRDFDAAEKALADDPAKEFEGDERRFVCRDFVLGWIKQMKGDVAAAKTAFASARPEQAKYVEKWADDANPLIMLARTDAALGRKEDALAEGRRAMAMRPIAKDAVEGPSLAEDLALVYLQAGERELALDQLEALEQVPRALYYGDLAKTPDWDPLRNEPRFQAILAHLREPIPFSNMANGRETR